MVSRWLIRKRVTDRVRKIKRTFEQYGATTREEVRAFIEEENAAYRKSGGKNTLVKGAMTTARGGDSAISGATIAQGEPLNTQSKVPETEKPPPSVASMVFSSPNDQQVAREFQEQLLARNSAGDIANFSPQMIRRILFPKCLPRDASGGGSKKEIPPLDLRKTLLSFNDKTFFQLKVRPEYVSLGYAPSSTPPIPVYYPPCNEKGLRTGAPEELFLRSPADATVGVDLLNKLSSDAFAAASCPPIIQELSVIKSSTVINTDSGAEKSKSTAVESNNGQVAENIEAPLWLSEETKWPEKDRDYFHPDPEYRIFMQTPRRCEFDTDWPLRPNLSIQALVYAPDTSLRTR